MAVEIVSYFFVFLDFHFVDCFPFFVIDELGFPGIRSAAESSRTVVDLNPPSRVFVLFRYLDTRFFVG